MDSLVAFALIVFVGLAVYAGYRWTATESEEHAPTGGGTGGGGGSTPPRK